jgi:NAD(P)H-dependent FMN reductase
MVRIIVFSGSSRPESYNRRLAAIAARGLEARGAEVVAINLADFPLPFADEDGRAHIPREAQRLNEIIQGGHGLFIASPEYNSGYPALVKNALDWVSMAKKGGPGLAGKVVALGAASTGARGGYRALTQFRAVLELGFGALVIPEMASVPMAAKNLPDDRAMPDEALTKALDQCLDRLLREASHIARS